MSTKSLEEVHQSVDVNNNLKGFRRILA
ncbi:MAG: hypothetical protein RL607_1947, partial [Bacteroidota bacterium]